MSRADKIFVENMTEIMEHGFWDTDLNVRPRWEDGTPAHTVKKFGVVNRYDLREELPILTIRRTAFKSCIDELLWIWQKKGKRSEERRKQKLYAMREAAQAGDPVAIAQYEEHLAYQRERNQKHRQKLKEAREASPEYLSQLEEKERIKREKMLETERKRVERAKKKNKLTRAELKEKAKTDPEAAKQLEAMRAKEAEARQRKKEREEARMVADPEYAAMMEARKKEYIRTRTAKRKAEHEALVELAKTDEEAARKLAEKRKYQSEATVKCYQKLKADAEAGDPEAIKRYEAHLAKRREDYHKKKAEKEDIPA